MNAAVSWAGLSLVLVAVAAGISWWQDLGLQRQILIAAARALGQLLLVGAALTLIISPGRSIWWSWLWVAAMLGYASTVARPCARHWHPRGRSSSRRSHRMGPITARGFPSRGNPRRASPRCSEMPSLSLRHSARSTSRRQAHSSRSPGLLPGVPRDLTRVLGRTRSLVPSGMLLKRAWGRQAH